MRRIAIATMTTVSGLALLFSYHTSTNSGSVLVGASATGGSPGTGGAASDGRPATQDPAPAATTDAAAADPSASDPAASDPAASDPAAADPAASSAAQAASPTPTAAKAAQAKVSGQFTGDTVDTRWGPVQVVIVVKNGTVVGSDVIQIPHDNPRDQEINQVAVPILNQEVLSGQSATIDGVSGATVTSDGYRQSLQSAFDRAHL